MAQKVKCNSCGGTYERPAPGEVAANYHHVCPLETIDTHAVCDDKGNIVTPATMKPTPNPRDERLRRTRENPEVESMVSEGSGITVLE